MVIPIEESLIYVRPLYLRASGGRIPELTRVIVAYQNQIVMEETLEAGLTRLFGEGAARPQQPETESTRGPGAGQTPADATPAVAAAASPGADPVAALAAQARGHYDRAIDAQRAGDWAKYGEEIRRLGETLQKMQQR
jgi:uncharacterized membrane protein (UPF0182 family)